MFVGSNHTAAFPNAWYSRMRTRVLVLRAPSQLAHGSRCASRRSRAWQLDVLVIAQPLAERRTHVSSTTPPSGPPTGRFTGSLLFSQMLFNLRSGIESRVTGAVIALTFFVIAVAPVPHLISLPSFLPAALLLLFGYDISVEWLLFSWPKISPLEFVLLLCTLALMLTMGVQKGLMLGLVACFLAFAAQMGHATVVAAPGMVS